MSDKSLAVIRKGTGTLGNDSIDKVFEQGEARSVALEDIEKGITALWQAAGKPRDGEDEPAVMRACVLNLIICADNDKELDNATQTITRLTWTYPNRTIVLVEKPNLTDDSLTAWISAHCQMPDPKGRKVCCEQITIEGHGAAVDRMATMVLPLLVADLPVVLWWMDDPKLESPLFKRLIQDTDRLVVDSRHFHQPAQSFRYLADLYQNYHNILRIGDLNWSRLTPWRNELAQVFDYPAFLPFIFNVDKLEVEYEAPYDSDLPNFSEALLLVGWLAKVLGWQPAFSLKNKGSNATLILDRGGQPLNVDFHGHNERKDEVGGITLIRLRASLTEENREALITISLGDDYQHATTTVEENGEILMTRLALLQLRDETDLLHEELGVVARDVIFEGALDIAGKFAGGIKEG